MTDENLITLTLEERLNIAEYEVIKQKGIIMTQERDASITYAMCQHFITRCNERGDTDEIREAVRWALADTGIEPSDVRDFLYTSGLTDPAYAVCEYNVTITVPVTITLSVEASSDDEAEEFALNEAESNGLDSYYNEVDWYRAEIENVEEC